MESMLDPPTTIYPWHEDGRSLDELEGVTTPDPEAYLKESEISGMIRRYTELRRTPVCQFEPEDLAMMIRQRSALDVIVPYALQALDRDVTLETNSGSFGMLFSLAGVDWLYWRTRPVLMRAMVDLLERALSYPVGEDGLSEMEEPRFRNSLRFLRREMDRQTAASRHEPV